MEKIQQLIQGKIYKVTNILDKKVYIGQTILSLETRWKTHCHSSSCPSLRKAIDDFGEDSFCIEQIDSASTIEGLNTKEKFWIEEYVSYDSRFGYNLTDGGRAVEKPIKKFSGELGDPTSFISLIEASQILGVSAFTVKRYIKQGKIQGARTPGGHWRVSRGSCIAYLSGGNK